MSTLHPTKRPIGLALLLIVGGALGWIAALDLSIEKVRVLADPNYIPSCSINPFVDCGVSMGSAQGALFGFPNPFLGVAAFVAPIVVGMALLAGARLQRWFWMLFTAGLLAGWVFVTWLAVQAIFVLGSLCPWCMLVWAVQIPMFWTVLTWGASSGALPAPAGIRRGLRAAGPYLWLLPAANIVLIVVVILVRFPSLPGLLLG